MPGRLGIAWPDGPPISRRGAIPAGIVAVVMLSMYTSLLHGCYCLSRDLKWSAKLALEKADQSAKPGNGTVNG